MRRRNESIRPGKNPDPGAFLPLPNLPYQILVVLAESQNHGWGIIKRVEELSGARAKPSSGSLYLAIARLETHGLAEPAPAGEPGAGQEKKVYTLTPLGRAVLQLETARLSVLVATAERSLQLAGAHRLNGLG
jgi:DNA-binding PadR family transcriptional regulator